PYQPYIYSFPTRRSSDLNFDADLVFIHIVHKPNDTVNFLKLRMRLIDNNMNPLNGRMRQQNLKVLNQLKPLYIISCSDVNIQIRDRKSTRLNSSHVKISY